MKRIPLYQRIRRERHRKVARLQDAIVEAMYEVFPRGVLHGGTAIWRCYSGNRFSEDVDVCIERNVEKIDRLFVDLKRAGFEVVKRRTTKNSLYSVLSSGGTEVRFEASFRRVEGTLREYETYEGILLNVFTPPPGRIIREKVSAYLKRRKIRDLYDIFFMLRHVEGAEKPKSELARLLREFKEPVDEEELRALVLFGAIPTKKDIIEYLRRQTE